jgi:hypothetical protein
MKKIALMFCMNVYAIEGNLVATLLIGDFAVGFHP